MTKPKAKAAAAAAPPAKKPDPDRCAKSPDGIHHWIAEVTGDGPTRKHRDRCQACGKRVATGEEEV